MDCCEHKFEHHPHQLVSADRREGLHRALLVRNKIGCINKLYNCKEHYCFWTPTQCIIRPVPITVGVRKNSSVWLHKMKTVCHFIIVDHFRKTDIGRCFDKYRIAKSFVRRVIHKQCVSRRVVPLFPWKIRVFLLPQFSQLLEH